MKRYFVAAAAVALIVFLYLWIRVDPRSQGETVRASRQLMGSTWTLEVVHEGKPAKAAAAMDAAFGEVERIEKLMSEWRADSPISAVNAAAGKKPVLVPTELRELLERSIRYGEKSEGAFDITWRGMGRIWRFDEQFRLPTQQEVEKARKRVDYRLIQLEGDQVFLPVPDMAIGLGGIAAGYAVDRAAAVLQKAGFGNFLLDGSGDILVRGARRQRPWRVGIQHPRAERGVLVGSVTLSDEALATSGDYERFKIVDGVRYHHIIDPRTGWPARGAISVTVIAKSAEQADALSTAMFVLGPEKALQLAASEQVDLLLIDEQFQQHMTEGFRQRFLPEKGVSP
ncbi:MAG: FAD:protein FMN transferase [Bryobacteraceae bacterium]|nr:FAD:protein FMN transferase [Bryobacteraceae bacterium]MDW8377061.1 FAD:protein FMN transferase [Bryobacterales bacterium]